MIGWKEFEMEVMRDRKDNCVIVCSIENFDAMGVHTGDSITVAPALTLTDREYQVMRDASFAIMREIGVETGGSNVQFAVNPADGRLVVIEMNPRVSRSSALASKATGFPIAKIAAKLAVGYTLDEIPNDITQGHARVLRAVHRLHGREGAALGVREVPGDRHHAHHAHEERGRGHGDGPHVPRGARQGAALARERSRGPGRRRQGRPSTSSASTSTLRCRTSIGCSTWPRRSAGGAPRTGLPRSRRSTLVLRAGAPYGRGGEFDPGSLA